MNNNGTITNKNEGAENETTATIPIKYEEIVSIRTLIQLGGL